MERDWGLGTRGWKRAAGFIPAVGSRSVGNAARGQVWGQGVCQAVAAKQNIRRI